MIKVLWKLCVQLVWNKQMILKTTWLNITKLHYHYRNDNHYIWIRSKHLDNIFIMVCRMSKLVLAGNIRVLLDLCFLLCSIWVFTCYSEWIYRQFFCQNSSTGVSLFFIHINEKTVNVVIKLIHAINIRNHNFHKFVKKETKVKFISRIIPLKVF